MGQDAELRGDDDLHIGLSEASPDTIRRANAVHPIAALQTEHSLWTRDIETEVLPLLRELGIGLVPYAPLGHGFLTGQISTPDAIPDGDWRKTNPRFSSWCRSSCRRLPAAGSRRPWSAPERTRYPTL
jgi:aryl-alcohol dehydrogenase-like predicted oxidoreductase